MDTENPSSGLYRADDARVKKIAEKAIREYLIRLLRLSLIMAGSFLAGMGTGSLF